METFTNEEDRILYDCYLQAVNLRRKAESENIELKAFIEMKGLTMEFLTFQQSIDAALE
jgi:hypothetical protein